MIVIYVNENIFYHNPLKYLNLYDEKTKHHYLIGIKHLELNH